MAWIPSEVTTMEGHQDLDRTISKDAHAESKAENQRLEVSLPLGESVDQGGHFAVGKAMTHHALLSRTSCLRRQSGEIANCTITRRGALQRYHRPLGFSACTTKLCAPGSVTNTSRHRAGTQTLSLGS